MPRYYEVAFVLHSRCVVVDVCCMCFHSRWGLEAIFPKVVSSSHRAGWLGVGSFWFNNEVPTHRWLWPVVAIIPGFKSLLLLNGVVSIYIIIVGAPDLQGAIPYERGFTFLQKWSFGLSNRMPRGFRPFVVVTPWAHFSPCVFVGRYRRSCVSTSPLLARTYIFEIDLCNLQHIRARRFHLLLFFCLEFSCLR